jgi:protein-S-isoprenylcysteine O-methyltransferase Ste14
MTNSVPDRANFIIFPPVIPYSTLVIACLLQWLEPLGLLVHLGALLRIVAGAAIFAAGMAMMSAGHRAMSRHGTNVNPLRPTTALVTDGVFRYTRNRFMSAYPLRSAGLRWSSRSTGCWY